jgi:CRISPR/Cas system CSM-associated protein Csm5 (group 7 of RAMP superfamily)
MEPYSGSEAKVYSIIPEGEEETLFEKFVDENLVSYKEEIKDILKRLKQIGHKTGARESFFKHEGDNEFVRKYGKYVWALYDDEERKLRLYCIRFANVAIILGGGGYKDKSVIKWQDDEKLSEEVRKVIAYAESIIKQLDDGDLYWSNNGTELEGNLKNYDNE